MSVGNLIQMMLTESGAVIVGVLVFVTVVTIRRRKR